MIQLRHAGTASSPASESAGEGELSPEFREAQKVFKKDPEGALLAWARWQEDVGEYGEARRKYRELLIAYPENIEAQLGLARIELSCGRVEQAEEILTAVARGAPDKHAGTSRTWPIVYATGGMAESDRGI